MINNIQCTAHKLSSQNSKVNPVLVFGVTNINLQKCLEKKTISGKDDFSFHCMNIPRFKDEAQYY